MRYRKGSLNKARRLRRESTDAERRLWSRLRAQAFHGLKFRRQHPLGPYVVDFACLERWLVVELDGGQHCVAVDAPRTAAIARHGFRIVRFWNHDVLGNLEGVLLQLEQEIERTNSPHPLRGRGSPAARPRHSAPSPPEGERVGVRGGCLDSKKQEY